MKAASINEIKKGLTGLKANELTEICLRLARFKKENKELLTYLLFESPDEAGYLNSVKQEMDELMAEINFSHLYFVKKSLRKILRVVGKHVRYMGSKEAEVDLLIHFCTSVREADINLKRNTALLNLYNNQVSKLERLVAGLHEDIQYEYQIQIIKLIA